MGDDVPRKVLGGVMCTVELLVWLYKSNDLQYNKTLCECVNLLVSIKSPIRVCTSVLPGFLDMLDVLENQLHVTEGLNIPQTLY